MPKNRTYERLKVYNELHARIQLCVADPKNPNKDVATIFGKQPNELRECQAALRIVECRRVGRRTAG
jgi:hypothetical protein